MGHETSGHSPNTGDSATQLLDREQIDSLVAAAGVEGARDILDAFHRSTVELLNKLKDELGRGDLGEASRTAHALKGSALNVGALALSNAARVVEDACKTDNVSMAIGQLPGAGEQFNQTVAALESVLSNAA